MLWLFSYYCRVQKSRLLIDAWACIYVLETSDSKHYRQQSFLDECHRIRTAHQLVAFLVILIIIFIAVVLRWEASRGSKSFAPALRFVTRPLRIHDFGCQGPKQCKIASEIGKSHRKQKSPTIPKQWEIRKILLTTYRKSRLRFQQRPNHGNASRDPNVSPSRRARVV